MKKEELKKAFNKEFEKITISDELKTKTLNAINTNQKTKTSHLPYLRNFAAIFIVTLFCVSIYFTRNIEKSSQDITSNETNSEATLENNTPTLRKSVSPLETSESEKIIKEESSMLFDTISTNNISSPSDYSSSFGAVQSIPATKEPEILSISEDEFLKQHPNAEKIEKGYVIYENNKESLYIFNDGYLENIIIIE